MSTRLDEIRARLALVEARPANSTYVERLQAQAALAEEDAPYLLARVERLEKEVLQLVKINEGRHYMLRHDGKWFAGEKTAINWLSSRLKALEPTE